MGFCEHGNYMLKKLVQNTREISFLYPDRQRQAERRSQEEARADVYRERDRERKRKQYLGVVKVSILYDVVGMRNVLVKIMVLRDGSVCVVLDGSLIATVAVLCCLCFYHLYPHVA